jgi:hypothetical protein
MKNLKTTMIAALLMIAAVGGVGAQEKYHFARVAINTLNGKEIEIVTDNEPEKPVYIDKAAGRIKQLLKVVHQMTAEGWEVINAVENGVEITYFLKKKES